LAVLYFRKIFSPPLKNLAGKPLIFKDRCQSETHNFEMAHHVEKQITDVSIYDKRAKMVPNLKASPHGFDAT